ncbi:MAG: 50S ribosomal protein L13 [Candidatus Woesearchaeota archaeon]
MAEINIDATNLIVGRMASYVAKQALLGHSVNIFNCEKAIMTGGKKFNVENYRHLIKETGQPQKGPFLSRLPDRFVRRQIRGMLPHKKPRGAAAFKRIMCYVGVPEEFKGIKMQTLAWANSKHKRTMKLVTIGEICRSLGGRFG